MCLGPIPVVLTLVLCVLNGRGEGYGDHPRVVFAVNAGGDEHLDVHGIHYEKDPLKVGIASDYGKHLMSIGRVYPNDQILYQTERYHHSTFGYDVPVQEDGDYVMVLSFARFISTLPTKR